jgi:hypothetical protein
VNVLGEVVRVEFSEKIGNLYLGIVRAWASLYGTPLADTLNGCSLDFYFSGIAPFMLGQHVLFDVNENGAATNLRAEQR